MKNITITILSTLLAVMTLVSPVRAEMVTRDDALTAAKNWVTLIIQKEGDWGGSETAEVQGIQEFKRAERLLGYFCHVKPTGYIVISLRKELAPVKAYSTVSDLKPEFDEGMVDFIKSGMENTLNEIEKQAGPVIFARTEDVEKLLETDHRPDWEKLEHGVQTFKTDLASGAIEMKYVAGQELLTSNWHQKWPYNRYCEDMGCTDPDLNRRAKVGCVALAAAQIMRYWGWPPYKDPFSVSYAWPNMPDSLTTSCPQTQIDAVATLCREVGGEAGMNYGCSESTAWCGDNPGDRRDMLDAYEKHFRYHDGADFDLRIGEGAVSWFNKIKNDLNSNRPLQYAIAKFDFPGIAGHSMVCDGWRQVGASLQCHMNDGSLAWVDMTDLPGAEGMIKNIRPGPSLGNWLSKYPPADENERVDYWADSPDCDPRGDGYGFRYFDQDAQGRNVTFHRGHYLQFLPGVKVTGTSPIGDCIRFIGRPSENARLFSFKGTQTGGVVAGIRIYDGGIRLYNNGSIRFHE